MTRRALLRIAKKATSWQSENPVDTARAEFFDRDGNPYLQLSVYEIEDTHPSVVRAHSEHMAGAPLDPPSGAFPRSNVDVSNVPEGGGVNTPAPRQGGHFSFTDSAHVNVCFKDLNALRQFIHSLLQTIQGRERMVYGREIKQFVKDKLAQGDQEWTQYCAVRPKWRLIK